MGEFNAVNYSLINFVCKQDCFQFVYNRSLSKFPCDKKIVMIFIRVLFAVPIITLALLDIPIFFGRTILRLFAGSFKCDNLAEFPRHMKIFLIALPLLLGIVLKPLSPFKENPFYSSSLWSEKHAKKALPPNTKAELGLYGPEIKTLFENSILIRGSSGSLLIKEIIKCAGLPQKDGGLIGVEKTVDLLKDLIAIEWTPGEGKKSLLEGIIFNLVSTSTLGSLEPMLGQQLKLLTEFPDLPADFWEDKHNEYHYPLHYWVMGLRLSIIQEVSLENRKMAKGKEPFEDPNDPSSNILFHLLRQSDLTKFLAVFEEYTSTLDIIENEFLREDKHVGYEIIKKAALLNKEPCKHLRDEIFLRFAYQWQSNPFLSNLQTAIFPSTKGMNNVKNIDEIKAIIQHLRTRARHIIQSLRSGVVREISALNTNLNICNNQQSQFPILSIIGEYIV